MQILFFILGYLLSCYPPNNQKKFKLKKKRRKKKPPEGIIILHMCTKILKIAITW